MLFRPNLQLYMMILFFEKVFRNSLQKFVQYLILTYVKEDFKIQ